MKNLRNNRNLKVLLVSPLPPPAASGIAVWTELIIKEIVRYGIKYSVVDTAVRWRNPSDRNIVKRITGGAFQSFAVIGKVFIKVLFFKPDVVHLCSSASLSLPKDLFILTILRIMNVRSVFHIHMGRIPELKEKNGLEYALIRKCSLIADLVITIDQKSYQCLGSDVPVSKIRKIPNIIDVQAVKTVKPYKFDEKYKGKIHFLFAGHIIPSKGIRELFEAFKNIKRNDWVLHLTGPVTDNFRKELESYGLGEKAVFYGEVEKNTVISIMKSADAFIFPTYSEGFPNVILESMASGLPIISTPAGAIPEMLDFGTDNSCGLEFPAKSYDLLLKSIELFLDKRVDVLSFSRKAYEKVTRKYSSESAGREIIDLWKSMV